MSGHHSHSRPIPLQNNSHSSTASPFGERSNYESPSQAPTSVPKDSHVGSANEGKSSTHAQAIPSSREGVTAKRDSSVPKTDVDPELHSGTSAVHGAISRSPNRPTSPHSRALPRAKEDDSRTSASLAAVVKDVFVSTKQRTDGFEPRISRRSMDATHAREYERQSSRSSLEKHHTGESARSPRKSGEIARQKGAQPFSPEQSSSTRHVNITGNRGTERRHGTQQSTSDNQPMHNGDATRTPASSPPPKTPNSDDVTHHGNHTSSITQKTPGMMPPSTTKESLMPIEGSATPHMDLATYPTQDLLRLLASLLQQIASANDGLREEAFSHKSEHSGSQPTSPSARNRTRKSSAGEIAGKLCIPPFRPRPSHADSQSHGSATPPTGNLAAEDSAVKSQLTDGTSQEETAIDGSGKADAHRDESAPADLPSGPTVHTASKNGEVVLDNTPVPLSNTQGQADLSNTTDALRPKKPDLYRITTTAARQSLVHPSAILCFHARNVPSISIEAYLQRILKYCPITNEVFLSLLVYFDRMSKMQLGNGQINGPPASNDVHFQTGIQGFAIDSYNVHRLVIAGITVASKFFSDVFYTNSRYAKVGGLPLSELNQLELQFLLLNDFNLVIPLDEMQRYADQLLAYGQGKGMVGSTGPGIVYGSLPLMKSPSEANRDNTASTTSGSSV